MKITRKILNKFNQDPPLCFNLEYCKAFGLPTPKQSAFLFCVRRYVYGNNSEKITMNDVKSYLKENK